MNILVIGNGFDLAHGLPTKYTDFLFFCSAVKKIIKYNRIDDQIPKDDDENISWLKNGEKIIFKNYRTKDITFLIYSSSIYDSKHNFSERDKKVYEEIVDTFIENCFFEENTNQRLIKEILYLVHNNFWIDYFLKCDMHGDENWIDFESEISNVIKSICEKMHDLDHNNSLYDPVKDWPKISNNFLRIHFDENNRNGITFKIIRDKLECDLHKLIRVFEIYLTEYVEKIDINIVSPDIEKIATMVYGDRGEKGILFSKVISFNYSNIYEKVYLSKYKIDNSSHIDYIHGKAVISNTIETNNMVLGIDEFLSDDRMNKDIEFIAFKKFYQRIHKGTGCKYKEWTDTIKEEFADYKIELEKCKTEKNIINLKATANKLKKQYLNRHHVYILGHSLDVTDKDILRDLILNDNVYTTIFYHNKETMGKQIANLVKVIGQDELIKRTGGNTKTIEFKQQQNMVPIEIHT